MFLFISVFVACSLAFCVFAWVLPRLVWLQLRSRTLSLLIALALSIAILALVWLILFFFYELALRWVFFSDGKWTFEDRDNATLVAALEDMHRRLYWVPAGLTFLSATLRYFREGPKEKVSGIWEDDPDDGKE